MKILELMQNRYSVRKFDTKKVERWKIKFILDAAICAPTAVNYQPQRILVIDDEEGLRKIKDITPYHFNAPLVFVMCYALSENSQTNYQMHRGRYNSQGK